MHPNGVAISVLKDACTGQEGFTRDWQKTSLCLQDKDVKTGRLLCAAHGMFCQKNKYRKFYRWYVRAKIAAKS